MKKLFVGNLPFSATESDVRALFDEFGGVDSLQLVTDRETGKPRGFAFAEIADDQSADAAMRKLNGMAWKGRELNVNEARPQKERGAAGGGGFRSSRGGGGSRVGGGGYGGGFHDR